MRLWRQQAMSAPSPQWISEHIHCRRTPHWPCMNCARQVRRDDTVRTRASCTVDRSNFPDSQLCLAHAAGLLSARRRGQTSDLEESRRERASVCRPLPRALSSPSPILSLVCGMPARATLPTRYCFAPSRKRRDTCDPLQLIRGVIGPPRRRLAGPGQRLAPRERVGGVLLVASEVLVTCWQDIFGYGNPPAGQCGDSQWGTRLHNSR
jgi:hypothetical protein